MQDSNEILVATLYKFFKVDDLVALQDQLYEICNKSNVMGTILIANEGVNGTISAKPREIEKTLISIQKDDRFSEIEIKYSSTNKQPFHKMRVRLKKEIVTIGLPEINPNKTVGTYVKPEEWNDIISDPDIILIDTRNKFEIKIGSFKNALDPRTTSFRDFPEWVKKFKQDKTNTNKKIAMYCTGGIRCEKASSLMKEEGFNEVYHLQGGILKYLEQVEKEKSLWEGECFVFDDRV